MQPADLNQDVQSENLTTLKALFQLLRSGKSLEAQNQLIENNEGELLEWITGAEPQFDTTISKDQTDTGDFLGRDNIPKQSQFGGNRTNLLFVDSCMHLIQENCANQNMTRGVRVFQNAILGAQCGHFQALDQIVRSTANEDHQIYQNKLWAIFKASSQ